MASDTYVRARIDTTTKERAAETLAAMMDESGVQGLQVREMVDAGMLGLGASTARVPRGWLAGVRGALRN